MNNADIVRSAGSAAAKKREMAAAERAIVKANDTITRLDRELRYLEKLTEVREGIALEVKRGPKGFWIEAIGEDIRRCASGYLNQHNQRTWGLHTYTTKLRASG